MNNRCRTLACAFICAFLLGAAQAGTIAVAADPDAHARLQTALSGRLSLDLALHGATVWMADMPKS